jgi:hypothetical protein
MFGAAAADGGSAGDPRPDSTPEARIRQIEATAADLLRVAQVLLAEVELEYKCVSDGSCLRCGGESITGPHKPGYGCTIEDAQAVIARAEETTGSNERAA